jgi:hypothetical protein
VNSSAVAISMQFRLQLLVSLAVIAIGSSVSVAHSLRTVAFTGRAADAGGGTSLTFAQMGFATINENAEVALIAAAQPSSGPLAAGIWSEGGDDGLRLVALDGHAAPGISGGIIGALVETFPLINNQGQTTFRSRLAIVPGITTLNDSCVWIANPGGSPTLLLREGNSAPGAPAGAVFSTQTDGFSQRYSVFNNLGQVAMLTSLQIGTGALAALPAVAISESGARATAPRESWNSKARLRPV